MKKWRPIFVVMLCLIFSVQFYAHGDILEDALKDGLGIRPLGMGGAFTAVADDVNAIHYNPAGLYDQIFAFSSGNQDVNRDLTGGESYTMFNMGPLGLANRQRMGKTSDKANVATLGYGGRGGWGFSWGVSYKAIEFDTGAESSKHSWSADAGLIARVSPQLTIGLVSKDFAKDKTVTAPSTGRFGMAFRPFGNTLLLAADGETGRTGSDGILTNIGAELNVVHGLKFRAGSDKGKFTWGAGFQLPFGTLDYAALSDENLPSGSLQRFGFSVAVSPLRERPFSMIKQKEYALIDIKGQLIGGKGEFSLFGGGSVGADEIMANIKRAARDPYIDGIILKISGFQGGMGSIGIVQELRSEIVRAKKAGKKIVAYIESSALGDEYYLASAADVIVAPAGASIGGIGRSVNLARVSGLFDKIGIEWQIITLGEYKDTFNQLSPKATKKQKEMVISLVDDMYRQMITDISASRGIDIAKVKEIGDGRIFTAEQAEGSGLVDEIGYFRDALLAAGKLSGVTGEVRVVTPDRLIDAFKGDFLISIPYKIAVIEIDGEIVTGRSRDNILFGGRATGADTVTEQLRRASDDFGVRAIILRVNSPGGSAVASGQINMEIKRAREKGKIVVASFGDMAASGGYYAAAFADRILANPGTMTGSIGVIFAFPVFEKLFEKIGVDSDVVKEGKHADMLSGLRKLTPEERSSLKALGEASYQEFIGVVAEGRGISKEVVANIAEGKIYTGSQAKELDLVDELGGFSSAVDAAKELAKIPVDPELVFYREDRGFLVEVGLGGMKLLGLDRGLFPLPEYKLTEYRMAF